MYSLGPFLTATAQLQPKVNIKQIVIALIDRLASYAAREAESENPEETKKQEEAAARRLAERVKMQKARVRARENGSSAGVPPVDYGDWGSPPSSPADDTEKSFSSMTLSNGTDTESAVNTASSAEKGEKKETAEQIKKFRGVPENVRLFEVFWQQVVELIKVYLKEYHQVNE